jgi:hypothetical protein
VRRQPPHAQDPKATDWCRSCLCGLGKVFEPLFVKEGYNATDITEEKVSTSVTACPLDVLPAARCP